MRGIVSNLHTHCDFSDGLCSMEEQVNAAIGRGFVSLGMSDHAYAPYDGAVCMKYGDIPRYFAELKRLREAYRDKIELYCGLEGDYYYPPGREELDYVIGSNHYLYDDRADEYITIDHLPERFERAMRQIAGGDVRRMVERYYDNVADMAENQRPDIIGHLDLITKLNRGGRYYDEGAGWYRAAVSKTLAAIQRAGCIVEINTGSMFRGYLDRPYPDEDTLREILSLGIPVQVNSDSHSPESLDHAFGAMRDRLLELGFSATRQLVGGAFVDIPLV